MGAVPEGPVPASSCPGRHRIWRLLPIPPPRTGGVLDRFRRREVHDEGLAAVILGRVLERGRFIHLDGPSRRTGHLNLVNLEETLPRTADRANFWYHDSALLW